MQLQKHGFESALNRNKLIQNLDKKKKISQKAGYGKHNITFGYREDQKSNTR